MSYFVVAILLYLSLYLYIFFAKRNKIIDTPNHRSSHTTATIRGGGVIFPLSLLTIPFIVNFQNYYFLAGLLIISSISFWDDLKPLTAMTRFIFHLIAIILMLMDIGIEKIPIWAWPFVIIIIAGIINAFNFMDGINGITGTYSLSILISVWFINNTYSPFIQNEFILTISIAVLVFLIFNFRKKAICFAGDIGSVSIAYILTFIILKLIIASNNPIYLLLFSVYGIDSTLTILIRLKNKENIFEAHRTHLYQLLSNEFKLPHLVVSSIYALLQILISGLIIFLIKNIESLYKVWATGFGIIAILISFYFYVRNKITTRFS